MSAMQWFDEILSSQAAVSKQGQVVTLYDGAPAVVLRQADYDGTGVASYLLFAKHDNGFFLVQFQTDSADFASESGAVVPIVLRFKGQAG
jgi:hypothetical protein